MPPKRKKPDMTAEQELAEERVQKEARAERVENTCNGFAPAILGSIVYNLPYWPAYLYRGKIKDDIGTSLIDIFLHIMTEELLETIWNSHNITTWMYGSGYSAGTLFSGRFWPRELYIYFALYIRIVGRQEGPKENRNNRRPLRENLREAMAHFGSLYPDYAMSGREVYEILFARFKIKYQLFDLLSSRFRSCLAGVGRVLAGDEKLLHFTGDSAWIRQVPSKPDKVGLWFFELVCRLRDKQPFIVYARLSDANQDLGKKVKTEEVIKEWANISKEFIEKRFDLQPVIVFDSYYMSMTGRDYLVENKVPFIGAVRCDRLPLLHDALKVLCPPLEKPGQTCGIYNEDTSELFVNHWDAAPSIGKKFVLSNCHAPGKRTRGSVKIAPAYDEYKKFFNGCDVFNRKLHDRKDPHRAGGGNRTGEEGHCHKFIMACVLQNVFNLHDSCHDIEASHMSFEDKCIILSDRLFNYAISVYDDTSN